METEVMSLPLVMISLLTNQKLLHRDFSDSLLLIENQMKNKFIQQAWLTLIMVLAFHVSFSQNSRLVKADELYNRYAYAEAIDEYEAILKKNPDLTAAKISLADCYRLTGASDKAEYWYLQVVNSKEAKPEHKFYYGQALMNNKEYDLAKVWLEEYQKVKPDDKRVMYALKSIEHLPEYFRDSASYQVRKLNLNSPNADFSPVLYNDGIVFASSRESKLIGQKKHEWTGQPFLNLYYSQRKGNLYTDPEIFASNVQVKYNDGPVCFNKKGDEIYITRNNADRQGLLKSDDKVIRLKIFYSKKINDRWTEPVPFQYNDKSYSCAHASLSPDGNKLYFSSDKPGGYGGMDIYVCEKDTAGWGAPRNLGEKVNTQGNELFPYEHDDGTFVFSSNGRDGLGGLDVYWCRIKDNGIQTDAKNLGSPVNSSEDDFGVVFDNAGFGYLSSNREFKNTNDEIYLWRKTIKLKGVVVEKANGKPIAGARVVLKSPDRVNIEQSSKEDGTFEFPLAFGTEYTVEAGKDSWSVDKAEVSTVNIFPVEDFNVKLQLEKGQPKRTYQLIVNVIDKETRQPIKGASIGLDETDKTLGYTEEKGRWKQPLIPNTTLHMIITKPGYQPKVIYMSNAGQEKEKDYEFTVELRKGNDIGPYDRWYKIVYFDFDKSDIRDPDGTKIMLEVVQFLKDHPDARLLMNSYCDARGTAQYNMKLSKRRAEGATQFLAEHGIDRKMVEKMEWGGESMLINKCADGSLCSELDHQLNRRTEIRVIRVEKGGMTMKNK
jgi:outer membrane protein OmpA-like peptidoglycan-associated protein/tetratricopeptide (TPR) repeat protein